MFGCFAIGGFSILEHRGIAERELKLITAISTLKHQVNMFQSYC